MIKLAGAEDSGITDPATSKRIFVTTTARKTFRAANANWAKVRNILLNTAIANDFARAKPQQKLFRVRKDPNSVGQVRDSSNGRYIAIIGSSDVKIVAVEGGVPMLRAVVPTTAPVPAPVALPDLAPKTQSSQFKGFLIKHAAENVLGDGVAEAIQMLSDETGISINKLIKQIDEHPEREELLSALRSICPTDDLATNDMISVTEDKNSFMTDPLYEQQGALPSSALSLQVGMSIR